MGFRIAAQWLIRTGCYQNRIAWRYFFLRRNFWQANPSKTPGPMMRRAKPIFEMTKGA
jgi:hypothetical protein